MIAHHVLSALADIREGRVRLTDEERTVFLDAIEELARVLIDAPRGGDSLQIAIWYTHERAPALARLVDAARPGQPSLVEELEVGRLEAARVVRRLRDEVGGARSQKDLLWRVS
jgi:hypothetical protein